MPVVGLLGLNGEEMTFEEGLDYFENTPIDLPNGKSSLGIIPAQAILAMVAAQQEHESKSGRLSASRLWPDTNCRRQIYMEQFLDYYLYPPIWWEAMEGTVFHMAFNHASQGKRKGWKFEQKFPDPYEGNGYKSPVDGRPVFEVWPGIWLTGTCDAGNGQVINDLKTSKYPRVFGKGLPTFDFGERNATEDWVCQLNTYAEMWEMEFGESPQELYVWRMYRGSQDRSLTWRKFSIPRVSKETLWEKIGPFVTSAVQHLEKGVEIEQSELSHEDKQMAHLEYAKNIPMDGDEKKQFNGKKCPVYCTQYKTCFGLAGKMSF